jgi:hypothetical protein
MGVVNQVAGWLSQTSLSLTIQTHDWVIPTIQSIHIIAIGAVFGSVFMIGLRVLGWAGRDQTLSQTVARFGPWLSWGLCVLFVTGLGMVIGEPVRELLALSFWLKMGLVAIGTGVAAVFRRSLARQADRWETTLVRQPGIRMLAVLTLLVWASVIVLGRLIAYDYVWGSWSPKG